VIEVPPAGIPGGPPRGVPGRPGAEVPEPATWLTVAVAIACMRVWLRGKGAGL
jgi:hypothetical protein